MPLPDLLRGARRIVCLGDSITEQGDAPNGYVDIIRNALLERDIEVISAGIGGHRSSDMRARFTRDVLRHRPDLVAISCGINDVWHGFDAFHPDGGGPRAISLPAFRQNVQAMVEAAQGERVMAVVLSTTVLHEEANSKGNLLLRDYNAVLEHIAGVTDSRFIPLQQPFLDVIAAHRHETGGNRLVLTTDGVHLNERGNALMAKLVLEGLSGEG
jgi:lysophospholipase L1-like esterase